MVLHIKKKNRKKIMESHSKTTGDNVGGNPKIMLNFILLEISEYYAITFLVLFVPVDTENQAVQQSLQLIMYIFFKLC